ncbi:TRIM2_3 [Mytilus coruscus]|uniref:TRIM2_3 n=1 Tax=Mytilus coruscus TaxID=42192 RepID=A0A6J8DXV0_MYTCO|nr:TRIM2_3 [Mytilus coruscus]
MAQVSINSKKFIMCPKHKSEIARFFCDDDQVLICDDCILDKSCSHNGHTKIKLKHYISKKREDLKQNAIEAKYKNLPDIQYALEKALKGKTDFNAAVDKQLEGVKLRREMVKKVFDELQDDLIKNFESARKAANEDFDKFSKRQQLRINFIQETTNIVESRISNMLETEVLSYDEKLSSNLKDDPDWDVVLQIQPPRHQCQNELVQKGKLQSIIGYMQSGTYDEAGEPVILRKKNANQDRNTGTEEENGRDSCPLSIIIENKRDFLAVKTFKRTAKVAHIVPKQSLQAWLIHSDIEELDCSSGMVKTKIIKSIEEEPQCAARNNANELIIGMVNKKSLRQLKCGGQFGFNFFSRNKSYTLGNYVNTAPLLAVCLCTCTSASVNGDITVCLVEKPASDQYPVKNPIIRRYANDKTQHVSDLVLSEDKINIEAPAYISENTNGDLCIVSCPEGKSSWITIADETGTMTFRYPAVDLKATSRIDYEFIGAGFLSDGTITVLDRIGFRQHLLDKEGVLLQKDTHESLPACLAIAPNDHVWIGFEDGQVKIFTYKDLYSEI